MARSTIERVEKARDKLRAAGLRPVQMWIPDVRRRGFAKEISRQCRLIATAEDTAEGREDAAFWEVATSDTWE